MSNYLKIIFNFFKEEDSIFSFIALIVVTFLPHFQEDILIKPKIPYYIALILTIILFSLLFIEYCKKIHKQKRIKKLLS